MTRFAKIPRAAAIAVLTLTVALIAYGLTLPDVTRPDRSKPPPVRSDQSLYRKVVRRVRAGEPYEAAAVSEQRAEHYRLRPFLTVRPPLLTIALARLPNARTGEILLALLAAATAGAWMIRLRTALPSPIALTAGAIVVVTGVGWGISTTEMSLFHEPWASLLIALSLALRTDRRFLAAAALGLLAALIRELAMPYLLVMAAMALAEKRRGETTAFAAALVISLAALAWHAHAVNALVTSHDRVSQGWLRLGGWAFVLSSARWNIVPLLVGQWVSAVIVPLGLLGALGRADGLGRRLAALTWGYVLGLVVFGRPENYYWGVMMTPLLAAGLVLAPAALRDLVRTAAARPRHYAH